MMIDAGSRNGSSDRQPPCLGDEEVRANEGDQPNNNEQN
jgi:hypothetical protein